MSPVYGGVKLFFREFWQTFVTPIGKRGFGISLGILLRRKARISERRAYPQIPDRGGPTTGRVDLWERDPAAEGEEDVEEEEEVGRELGAHRHEVVAARVVEPRQARSQLGTPGVAGVREERAAHLVEMQRNQPDSPIHAHD